MGVEIDVQLFDQYMQDIQDYDLYFIDIEMPEIDGFTVAKMIPDRDKKIQLLT